MQSDAVVDRRESHIQGIRNRKKHKIKQKKWYPESRPCFYLPGHNPTMTPFQTKEKLVKHPALRIATLSTLLLLILKRMC